MKSAKEHAANQSDVTVNSMGELPAITGYVLPNWKGNDFCYRATAWAYLCREDGGDHVLLNGRKYRKAKT